MEASPSHQHGTVLIFALVILVVLTLVGISAMQVSTMEEIMAGNMKDCNQGFQSAEAAIRDASKWLSSRRIRPAPDSSATNNIYTKDAFTPGDADTPATHSFDWDDKAIRYGELDSSAATVTNRIGSCSPGTKPEAGEVMDDLYSLPCSVIEEHSFIPDNLDPDTSAKGIGRYYYRITSRGFGGTDKSQSRLEAIIFNRYN